MWLWIVLGVLGLAYMVFCPHVYHTSFSDFFAGLLVGLALVACFVRAPRAPSS